LTAVRTQQQQQQRRQQQQQQQHKHGQQSHPRRLSCPVFPGR
jgi:hypothetical protein